MFNAESHDSSGDLILLLIVDINVFRYVTYSTYHFIAWEG